MVDIIELSCDQSCVDMLQLKNFCWVSQKNKPTWISNFDNWKGERSEPFQLSKSNERSEWEWAKRTCINCICAQDRTSEASESVSEANLYVSNSNKRSESKGWILWKIYVLKTLICWFIAHCQQTIYFRSFKLTKKRICTFVDCRIVAFYWGSPANCTATNLNKNMIYKFE